MEIELFRPVEILPRSLNVLVAPESVAADALGELLMQRRCLFLYVCGNYSRLLSALSLRTGDFEIRRAFTAAQLLTIIREAHQTFVFIEHDPNLFAESEELLGYALMALKELSKESAVTIYSPFMDGSLRSISSVADRVFLLADLSGGKPPTGRPGGFGRRGKRPEHPARGSQSTLEVF
ncbi:MAG: hypothetical protein QW505_05930 [Thermoplasmata archaeon]